MMQAAMKSEVWAIATKVMDLFETGDTLNQVISSKQLKSKPEWKAYYLAPLKNLPVEFQVSMQHTLVKIGIACMPEHDDNPMHNYT